MVPHGINSHIIRIKIFNSIFVQIELKEKDGKRVKGCVIFIYIIPPKFYFDFSFFPASELRTSLSEMTSAVRQRRRLLILKFYVSDNTQIIRAC